MKIEFEANDRIVRLGRSMEISFVEDARRDRVRYRLTKSAVRKALLGLRNRDERYIRYRDYDYDYPTVTFMRARVAVIGPGGFRFGCQFFDRTQANLIRRWAGVPVR